MSLPTYRVVGVCPDGERSVISEHATRETAEKVFRLIQYGSKYREIVIEPVPHEQGTSLSHAQHD